jgi:hypothetical protein
MSERPQEPGGGTRKPTTEHTHVRRAIGGAAVLFGAWITWEIVHPVVRRLILAGEWQSDRLSSLSFLLVLPAMLLPGLVLSVSGTRLYRALDVRSLKWVFGAVAVLGAAWLASVPSDLFPGVLPERIETTTYLLLSSLVALAAYIAALCGILRYFQLAIPNTEPLVGRLPLILIALQIWVLLSGIFREYSPIKDGYTHLPKEPWGILGVVVPIFAAYGAYRLASRSLQKTRHANPDDARSCNSGPLAR